MGDLFSLRLESFATTDRIVGPTVEAVVSSPDILLRPTISNVDSSQETRASEQGPFFESEGNCGDPNEQRA